MQNEHPQQTDLAATTPDKIFESVATALKSNGDNDADLVEIFQLHILKASPKGSAVEDAVSAILSLAEKRSNPPETENEND